MVGLMRELCSWVAVIRPLSQRHAWCLSDLTATVWIKVTQRLPIFVCSEKGKFGYWKLTPARNVRFYSSYGITSYKKTFLMYLNMHLHFHVSTYIQTRARAFW